MEGGGEALGQPKPPSTVSLDSTYADGESAAAEKRPLASRCSWAPFVVLVGLVLVVVGLVLTLDRPDNVAVDPDEVDPIFSTTHSSVTSGEGLTAPQKKLVEWVKQIRNANELSVEGGGSNVSLTGVLFPRNDSDTPLPFDAMVAMDSGVALPSRQYVALANGRGYKWVDTSLGYGDNIVTNGCLTANQTVPLDGLDSVVSKANWASSDPVDESEVSVEINGDNYTVSKEEDDYDDDGLSETEDARCWLIEREDGDFGLQLCTPRLADLLPKMDFADLFNATRGCPQLVLKTTRTKTGTEFSVPLPLRKWYASYEA